MRRMRILNEDTNEENAEDKEAESDTIKYMLIDD
jgi:hypothetical protein